jgi:hypothetical protein
VLVACAWSGAAIVGIMPWIFIFLTSVQKSPVRP